MTSPRATPGSRRDVGLVNWLICRVAGRATGTGRPPNLFLTLARSRGLFRGWLWFAGRLMPGGTLPRRETELVILRVAHLRDCRYEFDHHVRLARRAGLHDRDIERVEEGPRALGWTPRERALLIATDRLHTERDLDDETWIRLRAVLTEAECVELTMLATHYEMLATVITALRVQPDRRPDG
ncbi:MULTISPECIES: carboxymuconolactone decarboxylase family protein [Actinomadura]|uniref:Alkylhydroperoxidase AhpD family core domain-containing protein n=1 Tax=Actinomadura madurae TaxID=1993 RepID=A0A1I5V956_9ACTN|nr:carboxymuconolactone decarboxylase family protein [Actinomadura madurae]SFQ04043.1 alkylhydroperoxidase AhpD family core domain-containing protein [Actinomadura madurae]SPT60498.1 Arsenate reductase and related proteins, glutaredoxin family [Actinomadura madurae]